MEEIGNILRTCLDDHRRSNFMHSLRLMYNHEIITDEDLDGFSKEVQERIAL